MRNLKTSFFAAAGLAAVLLAPSAYAGSCCPSGATATTAEYKATKVKADGAACSATDAVLAKADGAACSYSEAKTKTAMAMKGADARIQVVKMHADFCGSCVKLDEPYANLQSAFAGNDAVNFVKMDFTNEETKAATMKMAQALGLTDYAESGQLGVILVVDTQSGEVIKALKAKHSQEQMASVITNALSRAS